MSTTAKRVVERHRDERRLAVARHAFDADLLRVDGLVGLEIVEAARRAPRPRAQRAPVVRLARLALVDEADDALRQAGAVVGLNAAGIERREAPAVGDELLRRRRVAAPAAAERNAEAATARRAAEPGGRAPAAVAPPPNMIITAPDPSRPPASRASSGCRR